MFIRVSEGTGPPRSESAWLTVGTSWDGINFLNLSVIASQTLHEQYHKRQKLCNRNWISVTMQGKLVALFSQEGVNQRIKN